jgi:Lysozyme inhibitor LprI
MRTPIEALIAMLFAVLAFAVPAAADDAGKIKACLRTEHDAGRIGRATAWIAARDADCKVPYDIYEGGSMARLDGASCLLDHTATRVLQLHVWQNMAKPE